MKKPSASVRQQQIVQLLSGRGEVATAELAARFGVRTVTIRRDLDALARGGRVTRTHGGALPAAPAVAAFRFQERRQTRLAEKQAIGRAAARLVRPGSTVILDTGTTTLEVARALGGIPRLTVLTSSLAVASALLAHEGIELVLLGGTVSPGSPDLSGALTEENLAAFRADLAFIGADAADARGLYTRSQTIARVSRAMLAHAGRAILVADSSKFGHTAFVRIAGWRSLGGVITDDALPPRARIWLRRCAGGRLTLAPAADGGKQG